MLQLIKVGVQMLDTDFMVGTDDRPLQQAPDAFDSVSMNVANNPFFCRMIYPLMLRVGVLNSPISGHFIGINRFRIWRGVIMDKLVKRRLVSLGNNLQTNLARSLDCSDCDSLVPLVATTHPSNLSANIGFIHFYNAAQKLAVNLAHGSADAMAEIPSRLVSHAKRPLDLQCRHAFLRFRHEVNGNKPLRERKVCIVKDGSACYRELIATCVAVVLVTLRDCRNAFRLAARTSHAFRPPQGGQLLSAFFVASELPEQLWKVHIGFEGFSRFFVHNYA